MLPSLLSLLKVLLIPQLFLFYRKLRDPKRAQENLLSELCDDLSKSNYGKKLKVSSTDRYQLFSSKVPIISYDQITPLITQHMNSNIPALTTSDIVMFERTSGSSGPVKYIPYTNQLLNSFTRMFALWCCDILKHGPKFKTGKTFMSVSHSLGKKEESISGKSIGTNDDLDYLNGWIPFVIRKLLVLPANVQKIKDPFTYRFVISLYLLSDANLEIISIWNPSLLESTLSFIIKHREDLISSLIVGKIETVDGTFQFCPLGSERLKLLKEPEIKWDRLWPKLKLISCWSSANASVVSKRLQSYFPTAVIQGKGLLATEAPLTIPLIKFNQYVPMIDEVFFEFEDKNGIVLPLWQVERGKNYTIIISQKGGLYRYKLGDQVVITGFAENTPCFEFTGRTACSDLVGEKLLENFVLNSLKKLSTFSDGLNILIPILPDVGKAYYLLICENSYEPDHLAATHLDDALRVSYHYNLARDLGQLAAPQISIHKDISLKYLNFANQKGISLGNIKTPSLISNVAEAKAFLESLDNVYS